MDIDVESTLAQLKKNANLFEVYETRTFIGYRNTKDGHIQTVRIHVRDAGPSVNPNLRYSCFATTDDGCSATGNPDASIEDAIDYVHWHDLDTPV